MKAWRLEKLGGRLALEDVPVPEPRPASVLVKVEASALMSYLKAYVEGKLPFYNPPVKPFTIGTNAIGTVEAVGRDVWGLEEGQRVVVSSHFVARENVDDPAQVLIGLTAGAGAADMLADWPDGTLAEYALAPVEAVTPLQGLEGLDATRARRAQPLHRALRRPPARPARGGRDPCRQRRDGRLRNGRGPARRRHGRRPGDRGRAKPGRTRGGRRSGGPARHDGRAERRRRRRREGHPRSRRRRRPHRLRHGRQRRAIRARRSRR